MLVGLREGLRRGDDFLDRVVFVQVGPCLYRLLAHCRSAVFPGRGDYIQGGNIPSRTVLFFCLPAVTAFVAPSDLFSGVQ